MFQATQPNVSKSLSPVHVSSSASKGCLVAITCVLLLTLLAYIISSATQAIRYRSSTSQLLSLVGSRSTYLSSSAGAGDDSGSRGRTWKRTRESRCTGAEGVFPARAFLRWTSTGRGCR